MKLTPYGAAGEVTGSCTLFESGNNKLLVDFGMFQGGVDHEEKNFQPIQFDVSSLSAVLITHAHLDHVGRLPLLAKNGYQGFIYCTPPTIELTKLILEDAYRVMEYDNRKFGRKMLYRIEDVEAVCSQLRPVKYKEPLELKSGSKRKKSDIKIIFHDAGHIFGSAFIEIVAESKKVVFSGDVGNKMAPIINETDPLPTKIDLLVCESTYGDREHEPPQERENLLRKAIENTVSSGGVLMIPSFALERTQELLYEFNSFIDRQNRLKNLSVFLDSPLGIDALKVYEKYSEYYDEEARRFIEGGDDIFDFNGLQQTYTREESMKINHTVGTKVIIAGAGMMNGGRIIHHALRYLSDHRNTILFIGYQSPGTLGWKILNGAPKVFIHGENVSVKCQIKMINAFSAHGDKNKLYEWITKGKSKPKKVLLNHGDKFSSLAFSEVLKKNKIKADVAEFGKTIEI